jgi:hypothetical protein
VPLLCGEKSCFFSLASKKWGVKKVIYDLNFSKNKNAIRIILYMQYVVKILITQQ